MSEIIVRPARVDEVRVVEQRRRADDLTMRLALELAESGGVQGAFDDAEAIGLALGSGSMEERFVGDLYVEQSFRGQGVGARLLDAALTDAEAARAFLFDSRDVAALALALRRGLVPGETLLPLRGPLPREEALMAMAAGEYRFDVAAIDPQVHAFALDALDRETVGTMRPQRHRVFAGSDAGHLFFLNAEPVAYAYCWPDGRIGPIAATSAAYLVQLLAFSMVTLQRSYGASWCSALVPASNVRTAQAALRAGLRIDRALTLASDAQADLSRYVAYHALAL